MNMNVINTANVCSYTEEGYAKRIIVADETIPDSGRRYTHKWLFSRQDPTREKITTTIAAKSRNSKGCLCCRLLNYVWKGNTIVHSAGFPWVKIEILYKNDRLERRPFISTGFHKGCPVTCGTTPVKIINGAPTTQNSLGLSWRHTHGLC